MKNYHTNRTSFQKGHIPWNKGLPPEKQPGYGKKWSEEQKRKFCEARKGHLVSDETKQKISNALKGHPVLRKRMIGNKIQEKHHSEETRRKIREAQPYYGKHLPTETCRKMSEVRKGKIPWNRGYGDYIRGKKNPIYGKKQSKKVIQKIKETKKARILKGELKGFLGGKRHRRLVKKVANFLDNDTNTVEIEKAIDVNGSLRIIDVLVNQKDCYEIGHCRQDKIAELEANGYTVHHLPYYFFDEHDFSEPKTIDVEAV